MPHSLPASERSPKHGDALLPADLIASLAELDARRLYLGAGCSSLFTYCTEVLHLSEHAAYGPIEAARAAQRAAPPLILARLAEGAVTLTTVCLLGPLLTEDNHERLLQAARAPQAQARGGTDRRGGPATTRCAVGHPQLRGPPAADLLDVPAGPGRSWRCLESPESAPTSLAFQTCTPSPAPAAALPPPGPPPSSGHWRRSGTACSSRCRVRCMTPSSTRAGVDASQSARRRSRSHLRPCVDAVAGPSGTAKLCGSGKAPSR